MILLQRIEKAGDLYLQKSNLDLHANKKKVVLLSAAFCCLCIAFCLIVITSAGPGLIQLSSLNKSGYHYSAIMGKSISHDDYYLYSSGIEMTVSPVAKICLTADIVMQTEDSAYSEMICWNADRLSSSEVAVSENLARVNNLKTGDILYSKSVITGNISEYSIRQIVPAVTRVRLSGEAGYNNGIIIMGYDKTIADNISHETLIFTNKEIDEVARTFGEMPVKVVYREDEQQTVLRQLLPYMCLLLIVSALFVVFFVFFLVKEVKYNFLRMMTLGFSRLLLNSAYIFFVFGVCSCCILGSFALSVLLMLLLSVSQLALPFMGILCAFSLAVMAIASLAFNRHMWGKNYE